jgi:hypothetical protein
VPRSDTAKLDLPATLRSKRFELAVATTYTFQPSFFEEYCLTSLAAFADASSVTVITDQSVYEAMITGPEQDRPRQANLQYLVHPVSVGGVFHAKLWLFVGATSGRLVVGSANLTRPGFTANAELVAAYDFDLAKNQRWRPLFREAFAFLQLIATRWPGRALASNLREMERQAPWLGDAGPEGGSTPSLVHSIEVPIIDRLSVVIGPRAIEGLYVVSPYFDPVPDLLDDVFAALKPARIALFTENGTTTLTTEWLKHPAVRKGDVQIFLCRYAHKDRPQTLHGKLFILDLGDRFVIASGSANFTRPGLARNADHGNVESVVVTTVARHDLDIRRLCDPLNSATLLRDGRDLRSAPRTKEPDPPRRKVRLNEAVIDEDTVLIDLDRIPEVDMTDLDALFSFQAGSEIRLRLQRKTDLRYIARAPSLLVQNAHRASTNVQAIAVRNEKDVGDSNWILLTNLIDIRSGQNVRRARLIKEACDGPSQFLAVLRELLDRDDEHALREFLALCDIQVAEAPRPFARRGEWTRWDAEGMRQLGDRNLHVFTSLHEVVLSFVDRHLRRLQRHLDYGTVAGIENFVHIALAIGGTVRTQLQRLTFGLNALTRPMTIEEWATYRERVDAYLERLRELFGSASRYFPKMIAQYGRAQVQPRAGPGLEAFEEVWMDVRACRETIEDLRRSRLQVAIQHGFASVEPQYNDRVNLMSDRLWSDFSEELDGEIRSLGRLIEAR